MMQCADCQVSGPAAAVSVRVILNKEASFIFETSNNVLMCAENVAGNVGRNETCKEILCSDLLLMNRALMNSLFAKDGQDESFFLGSCDRAL